MRLFFVMYVSCVYSRLQAHVDENVLGTASE